MPLILPGVISGALFAFVTSFDEVVAVLFIAGPDQQTIPRQMWNGIREAISPAILAVATILVVISIALADHGRAAAPAVGPAAGRDRALTGGSSCDFVFSSRDRSDAGRSHRGRAGQKLPNP
jgi:hypothetical protein